MANRKFYVLSKAAGAMALAVLLSACSSGDGNSRAELRKLAGVESSPSPQIVLTATPQPESTERPVIIEVTREIAQPVEVTRIVEVTPEPLPTADIQGFSEPAVNEDAQPCPKPFWKRNRCVATDAQIEAYANEVQP